MVRGITAFSIKGDSQRMSSHETDKLLTCSTGRAIRQDASGLQRKTREYLTEGKMRNRSVPTSPVYCIKIESTRSAT